MHRLLHRRKGGEGWHCPCSNCYHCYGSDPAACVPLTRRAARQGRNPGDRLPRPQTKDRFWFLGPASGDPRAGETDLFDGSHAHRHDSVAVGHPDASLRGPNQWPGQTLYPVTRQAPRPPSLLCTERGCERLAVLSPVLCVLLVRVQGGSSSRYTPRKTLGGAYVQAIPEWGTVLIWGISGVEHHPLEPFSVFSGAGAMPCTLRVLSPGGGGTDHQ